MKYKEATNLFCSGQKDPSVWVQWKGTDVCLDFHCVCGNYAHIDDYFCYNIRCGNCGKVYGLDPRINLVEIDDIDDENACVVTSEVDMDD